MKEIVIKVDGMVCGGCENRVQNAIKTMKGIKKVVADHTKGMVTIMMKEEVNENEIKEKIESIGFEVIGKELF